MFFFLALLFFLLGTSVIASPVDKPPHPRVAQLKAEAAATKAAWKIPNEGSHDYVGTTWYLALARAKTKQHVPDGAQVDYAKFVVININTKGQATLYKLGSGPGKINYATGIIVTRRLQWLLDGTVWFRWPSSDVPTAQRHKQLIMDLDGGKLRYKIIGHEVDMLKSKLKPPPHPGLKLPSQEFAQLSAARTWYRVPTDDAYAVDENDIIHFDPEGRITISKRPSEPGGVKDLVFKNLPSKKLWRLVGTWYLMPDPSCPMDLRYQLIITIEDKALQYKFVQSPPIEAYLFAFQSLRQNVDEYSFVLNTLVGVGAANGK